MNKKEVFLFLFLTVVVTASVYVLLDTYYYYFDQNQLIAIFFVVLIGNFFGQILWPLRLRRKNRDLATKHEVLKQISKVLMNSDEGKSPK